MKETKTNAARILDRLGIAYRTMRIEVGDEHMSAEEAAVALGAAPDTVYKTLVAKGDKTGPVVFVVPGDAELDLKKAAKASGNKSCAMLPLKELQPLTGYVRGGCSPIGMKKAYPTFLHEDALLHPEIIVNAGQRGYMLVLTADDLLRAVGGAAEDLTRLTTQS